MVFFEMSSSFPFKFIYRWLIEFWYWLTFFLRFSFIDISSLSLLWMVLISLVFCSFYLEWLSTSSEIYLLFSSWRADSRFSEAISFWLRISFSMKIYFFSFLEVTDKSSSGNSYKFFKWVSFIVASHLFWAFRDFAYLDLGLTLLLIGLLFSLLVFFEGCFFLETDLAYFFLLAFLTSE